MHIPALGFGLGVMALIGVALGLAVLAGVAATVTTRPKYAVIDDAAALVAGYSTALTVAAGLLLTAAALGLATLRHRPADTNEAELATTSTG
jgi:hypothetical protein